MGQFPSESVNKKACELLCLLSNMTIYDINETLDVMQKKLREFSSKQVYKEQADINVRLSQDFLEDLLQKFHAANLEN